MNQILQEFVVLGFDLKKPPSRPEGEDGLANKEIPRARQRVNHELDRDSAKFPALQRIPRIAIAEDMDSLAELYKLTLTRAGFNVLKLFSNGAELIDYLSLLKIDASAEDDPRIPDVVILDWRMPILDGIETAKILRANFPRMKIIMVSAYDLPKDASGYFDTYLNKPATGSQLTRALSEVLGS